MRYSVARQSDTEQQEILVPGWTRLRNHGASAGSAFGGGSAAAGAANNSPTATKSGLITPAQLFPDQRTPFQFLRSRRCGASFAQPNAPVSRCPKEDAVQHAGHSGSRDSRAYFVLPASVASRPAITPSASRDGRHGHRQAA